MKQGEKKLLSKHRLKGAHVESGENKEGEVEEGGKFGRTGEGFVRYMGHVFMKDEKYYRQSRGGASGPYLEGSEEKKGK